MKYLGNISLNKFDIKLGVVSGQTLDIHGKARVKVQIPNKSEIYNLDIIVVNSKQWFMPLLGRNWLKALFPNWRQKILEACNSVTVQDSLETERITFVNFLKSKYSKAFESDLSDPIIGYEAEIHLEDNATPIFYKPYEVPFSIREKVSRKLDDMQREDIIVPIKHSDWASPVVTVPKPDGSLRLCMDCKVTVNKVIKNEHYPLPNINDVLTQAAGYKYYTKIDLHGAYLQLKVSERSKKYLVINTVRGLYRFNRLPFGISCAASCFQRIMESILKDLNGVFCYLDDILAVSNSVETLKNLVEEIFKKLNEHNVKVNLDKCEFLVEKINYLGHELNSEGLRPSSQKLDAIVNAPSPKDISQLQSFLGMMNYYSKFVPNLSIELRQLYELLKKGSKFVWTDEKEKVFRECKKLLVHHDLLEPYDVSKEIVVISDSSAYGVGAVLCHVVNGVEKPVFYISSTLSQAERNYPNLHREALAVVFALTKFHKYIYGRKFKLVTDNKPLATIFNLEKGVPSVIAARLQKYAYIISIYNFKIEYRKGKKIPNADALSRLPVVKGTELDNIEEKCNWIQDDFPINLIRISQDTKKDQILYNVYKNVMNGWKENDVNDSNKFYYNNLSLLSIKDECLFLGDRVIVPKSCQRKVLEFIHGSHIGIVRMKISARQYVFWRGLNKDIEDFVKSCEVCCKVSRAKSKTYEECPKAKRPFSRLHVDFAKYGGKEVIIIVDSHSKWVDVRIMNRTDAQSVISVMNSVFLIFGLCDIVVSDNGPPFDSRAFMNFAQSLGIKLYKSPPYYPEGNGQAEIFVQTVKNALYKMYMDPRLSNKPLQEIIDIFLMQNRHIVNVTIGEKPSKVIFSYTPKTMMDVNFKPKNENENKLKKRVRFNLDSDKEQKMNSNLIKEKNCNVKKEFKVGNLVWYLCKYKTHHNWIKAKIVRINSPRTYYIDINGSIKLASINDLKERIEIKENIILPSSNNYTEKLSTDSSMRIYSKRKYNELSPDLLKYDKQKLRRSERIKNKLSRRLGIINNI